MKIVKKILRWIISIVLILIIIINFTLIIKSEVNKEEVPDFFGYTPFIIVSGSMEPTIKTNDVIITSKIKEKDIKVGDVLSYKSVQDNIIITHRLIEIKNENDQKVYIFKGDNNTSVDEEKVTYSNIQGKYLYSIPYIGTLVTYVKTPSGMAMVIAVILLIFVIFEIIERMFEEKEIVKLKNNDTSSK